VAADTKRPAPIFAKEIAEGGVVELMAAADAREGTAGERITHAHWVGAATLLIRVAPVAELDGLAAKETRVRRLVSMVTGKAGALDSWMAVLRGQVSLAVVTREAQRLGWFGLFIGGMTGHTGILPPSSVDRPRGAPEARAEEDQGQARSFPLGATRATRHTS
jgi:hypothetical protein